MRKLVPVIAGRVFDPAMCCSSGIWGPSVDPQLARFAACLDRLKNQSIAVERFNLSQQSGALADEAAVKTALETKGEAGLLLVNVNGEVKSSGTYPSRDELATHSAHIVLEPRSNGFVGGEHLTARRSFLRLWREQPRGRRERDALALLTQKPRRK